MFRFAIENLKRWKNSKHRKPLIIEGARQVGKTWLMKEFGRLFYPDTVYVNFDENMKMSDLFSSDLQTDRIVMGLELFSGKKINPESTLIIFDEVQEVPRALSSLKYFCEESPEYHIICAGSLLGIALHSGTSFPVGKVDFLKLYPLSYREFLMATGKEQFASLLENCDFQMITNFKQTYIDALKQYYFIGGSQKQFCGFQKIEILMRFEKFKSVYLMRTSRTSPNMHLMKLFPKLGWFGTVFPPSLQRKTGNLSMGLFVRVQGLRSMKWQSCGSPTVGLCIKSAE